MERLSGRVVARIVGLAVLATLAAPLSTAKTARELAAERYRRAVVLLEDLHAVPKLELGVKQYQIVADAFKSVHRASPASGYCDDALLAAAGVYAEMVARFGPAPHRDRATAAYRFLIREYPHSKLLPEAREAVRMLEAGERMAPAAADPKASEHPDPAPVVVTEAAPAEPADVSPAPRVVKAAYRYESGAASSLTAAVEGTIRLAPARRKESTAAVKDLRFWRHPDYVRIVIELDDFVTFKYDALAGPPRLYFDLYAAQLAGALVRGVTHKVDDPVVSTIRLAQNRRAKTRLVLDLRAKASFDVDWLANPPRMVLEVRPQGQPRPQRDSTILNITETRPPAREQPAAETKETTTFEEAFHELASESGVTLEHVFETAELRRPRPARAALEPPVFAPPSKRALEAQERAPDLPVASPQQAPTMGKISPPSTAPAPVPEPRPAVAANLPAPEPARATSRGTHNLIRALGLKVGRVVIDPGHGGRDTGSIGPAGLREKDVVLDVSKRLGKLIEDNLGAEIRYTRTGDTYLKPQARPQVANGAQADLFISVHANASSIRSVRGVETYYLNFTTDAWAMKVASRENAGSDSTVHELQDLLSKIAQKERIDESREFATQVQSSVYAGLTKATDGLRNRGVRKAPLLALIGAKMPAILAEIAFISNASDEKLLNTAAYRQRIAQHLYDGVAGYVSSLGSDQLSMGDRDKASASLD